MIPLGVLANSVVNETPWIDEDFEGLTGSIGGLRLHDRTAAPVSLTANGGTINGSYGYWAVSTSNVLGSFAPLLPLDDVGRKVRVRVDIIYTDAANHSRPTIAIGCGSTSITLGYKVYPVWGSGLYAKWGAKTEFFPVSNLTGPATVEVEYQLRGVGDHILAASVNGDKVFELNPEPATMGSRIGLALDGSTSVFTPMFDNLKVWIS